MTGTGTEDEGGAPFAGWRKKPHLHAKITGKMGVGGTW